MQEQITIPSNIQIEPLMSEDQAFIKAHNELTKKAQEQIPLVLRNKHSGWPLLQISLFIPHGEGYTHALGGGKCHYLNAAYYFLADLLTKVEFGQIESNFDYNLNNQIKKNLLVKLKSPLIIIKSEINQHGRLDSISICEYDTSPLNQYLQKGLFKQAAKGIKFLGSFRKDEIITEDLLKQAIDTRLAVFHQNQLYVDLGQLLERAKVSSEIREIFLNIFQVEKFNQLKPKIIAEESLLVPFEQPRSTTKQAPNQTKKSAQTAKRRSSFENFLDILETNQGANENMAPQDTESAAPKEAKLKPFLSLKARRINFIEEFNTTSMSNDTNQSNKTEEDTEEESKSALKHTEKAAIQPATH